MLSVVLVSVMLMYMWYPAWMLDHAHAECVISPLKCLQTACELLFNLTWVYFNLDGIH